MDASGTPLGSVDLTSGQVDPVEPQHEGQVRRAVQAYLRADGDEVVVPQQHASVEGLTLADEQLLRQWLGAPIMLGGPGPGDQSVRSVHAQLERLGDAGWTVAHRVPLGLQGSSCPHMLVGPPGVFAVRGIGRVGTRVEVDGAVLRVDGAPSTVLRDAVFEARRIQTLLVGSNPCRMRVQPVLAVTGQLEATGTTSGPIVVAAADVGDTLRRLDPTLRPAEQIALSRAVRRESTWS